MTDCPKSIQETIIKYENFINYVLREDLRVLQDRLIKNNALIADLIQQKHTLKIITDKKMHPTGFKSQVNLGCNFFMEAVVRDTSKMLINIGLNHFIEFTVPEANKYLDALITAYTKKADELNVKISETNAHIKMMLMGLSDLTNDKNKNR